MSKFTEDFKAEYGQRRAARAEKPVSGPRFAAEKKMSGVDKYLTQPRVAVPTWEYAVISFIEKWANLDDIRTQINLMGAHGWEMCERRDEGTGMTRAQGGWFTLFFKRRTS